MIVKSKRPKFSFDFGFIILCHNDNIDSLRSTANSIKNNYPGLPFVGIVTSKADKEEIVLMKEVCKIYKGGKTYTSLMNKGMRYGYKSWNMFVMAGSFVRHSVDKKIGYFLKDDKDIIFPIIDKKTDFVDCTLNGLLINKKTFNKIGKFEEEESLQMCKLLWANQAMKYGCKFKAILGYQIF